MTIHLQPPRRLFTNSSRIHSNKTVLVSKCLDGNLKLWQRRMKMGIGKLINKEDGRNGMVNCARLRVQWWFAGTVHPRTVHRLWETSIQENQVELSRSQPNLYTFSCNFRQRKDMSNTWQFKSMLSVGRGSICFVASHVDKLRICAFCGLFS